jgi:hypothetical protein
MKNGAGSRKVLVGAAVAVAALGSVAGVYLGSSAARPRLGSVGASVGASVGVQVSESGDRGSSRADSMVGRSLSGRRLGAPWNGGKPGLPVDVSSDLSGPIPAGVDHSMIVWIMIDQECSAAEVRLRGIEGVVVSGQRRVELGPCRPGERVEVPAIVRIPSGGAGFLAVDVILEEVDPEDGSITRRTASKAISVVAEGARAQPKSLGKAVSSGKSGMKGEEPEQVIELGQ